MRHHSTNRKFGRETDVRAALIRSLASALIERGKIRTTEAKAKELRPYVEKLITRAKKNDLASKRILESRTGSPRLVKMLTDTIAPKYMKRAGGYTRIVKVIPRASDASKMAIIEFV
ncbi:MAG: 50S ribosomal protein L17 [Patescibacteria group bacterium]